MPSLTHTECQVCQDTPFPIIPPNLINMPVWLPLFHKHYTYSYSIMHTPSIIQDSYRVYLNMYMEDRLYLASSGVMQLKTSWVGTVRTYDIFRDIARLQPVSFFPENRIVYFSYLHQFRGLVCCNWDIVNTAVPMSTQLGRLVRLFPFFLTFCLAGFLFFLH